MWRLLFTRRWLTALAVAAAFFASCVFLGRWQWGKHVERSAYAAAVGANYSAPARPLDQMLPAGADPLAETAQWTKVTATGRYLDGPPLMARNRTLAGRDGFEVLQTLRLADGTGLLVDRGWVFRGEHAGDVPATPATPKGTVTVTGWLRQGETDLGRSLPDRQVASINLAEAARVDGVSLRPAYLVLDSEDDGRATPPARPTPLAAPDTDTGPHFAYAMQWWGGSIVGFVIIAVYLRREHLDAEILSGRRLPKAPKPAKKRIWDEEDF